MTAKPDWKVGRKYTAHFFGEYTCVGIDLNGFPVLQKVSSDTLIRVAVGDQSLWSEVYDPVCVWAVVIRGRPNPAATFNNKEAAERYALEMRPGLEYEIIKLVEETERKN